MKRSGFRSSVAGVIVGVSMVLLAACAQPPTERLEAAQKAVEAARSAGAPEYAKEDFAKLEQEFALAKEELAKQEKTMAIFRSYADADRMLTRVAEEGRQVETKAAANKEAAKAAALAMEKEAQQAVTTAKELMAKAPVGKDRAAVEAIKQDLSGLEEDLGAVHQLIEKGDYAGAEAKAKSLKDKGAAVSNEIQQAIEKVKSGKTVASRKG